MAKSNSYHTIVWVAPQLLLQSNVSAEEECQEEKCDQKEGSECQGDGLESSNVQVCSLTIFFISHKNLSFLSALLICSLS